MSLSKLPYEIIQHIFASLTGKDVIRCRGVCRRWRQAVDGLGDRAWEKLCKRDYSEVCEDAYRKARISWRGLYKSLTLWRKLQSATMKYHIMTTEADHFEILQNGVAAVATYTGRVDKDLDTMWHSDTILYYDVDTLEERNRENYDFLFLKLKENEHVIAVKDSKQRLCFILKSNKKINAGPAAVLIRDFHLFENVAICRNKENIINIWKTGVNNVEFKLLDKLDENILAVKYKKDNNFNILTLKYNCLEYDDRKEAYLGNIYTLIGEDLRHACQIGPDDNSVINNLDAYGFNWKDKCIYTTLFKDGKQIRRTGHQIFIYGKIVVYAEFLTIHIYYDPFGASGKLLRDAATPLISVDLMEMNILEESVHDRRPIRNTFATCERTLGNIPCRFSRTKQIKKVEVVETENGHKVFLWVLRKIAVIEFSHI